MGSPLNDISDTLGIPQPAFIDRILDHLEDIDRDIAEYIFGLLGFEDEIVLTAAVSSTAIYNVKTWEADMVKNTIARTYDDICNIRTDVLNSAKAITLTANAKMNKPYYTAEAMQDRHNWEGFEITSNLTGMSFDEVLVAAYIENNSAHSPVTDTASAKHFPDDSETYLARLQEDSGNDHIYLGNARLQYIEAGHQYEDWIFSIDNYDYEYGSVNGQGIVKADATNVAQVYDKTTIITTIVFSDTNETTESVQTILSTAKEPEGASKSAYIINSDTTVETIRARLAEDVEGTTETFSEVITEEEVTFPYTEYLGYVQGTSYIVTVYTYDEANYVQVDALEDFPAGAITEMAITNLEMMPLVQLRNGTTNINGISDATYEAYTLALQNNTSEDTMPPIPKSERPAEGSAEYGPYVSTDAVLRTIGFNIDSAVSSVCAGQTDLDKVSGGYMRFAISPIARKFKRGKGAGVAIEDGEDEDLEYIPGVLKATWEFFELLVDNGNFSAEFPRPDQADPSLSLSPRADYIVYNFSAGGYNESLTMTYIRDDSNVPSTWPLGEVQLSYDHGTGHLYLAKQISHTRKREIGLYGLNGITSISRLVPENEDGSGPLVEAVDVVEMSLKDTTEAPLLLPLSLNFHRSLTSRERGELFFSGVWLQVYASEPGYLDYYETEDFLKFAQVVLTIVSVILTILTWGGTSWLFALIGTAFAVGGALYADHVSKRIEVEQAELQAKITARLEALKKGKENTATKDMEEMVLQLTDVVQLMSMLPDDNIPLPYDNLMQIALGDIQYNNDILYKEKTQIFCDAQSKIEFKEH